MAEVRVHKFAIDFWIAFIQQLQNLVCVASAVCTHFTEERFIPERGYWTLITFRCMYIKAGLALGLSH